MGPAICYAMLQASPAAVHVVFEPVGRELTKGAAAAHFNLGWVEHICATARTLPSLAWVDAGTGRGGGGPFPSSKVWRRSRSSSRRGREQQPRREREGVPAAPPNLGRSSREDRER